jgi:hypothetical protein
MLKDRSPNFAVLVGSCARGDQESTSDCDVLLCGIKEAQVDTGLLPVNPQMVVNYISYDAAEFMEQFDAGSLFLQHAFSEGHILIGDICDWNNLRGRFVVTRDFSTQLADIQDATLLLSKVQIFGGCFLTPLVSAFSHVKNASMYALARRGVYEFHKEECIRRAVQDLEAASLMCSLRAFYNYSIRGLDVALPFLTTDVASAIRGLRVAHDVVTGLVHDY